MKKTLAIILAILMVVTTIPMVALPASAALAPTATGGCNGNHSGYTQIKLNGGTTHRITKAGNYYINSSIYESTYSPALTIECSGTVTICLNGYDICHTGYGSRVVYLSPNGGELTVNLCDCKGTGEIYHEKGDTGIDFAPGVITLNMYGGTIRDCNSGLSTWSNSTVNMYGGTIKNCSYYGIYQDSNNGKVNIYGGSIINNNEGIRVCSADSVTLTGSPVISGNTNGDLYYRRPNSAVVAKDLSVSSPITIGQDREAAGDYAVVKVDSADMLGSFKYINNTKQLFYNNNQIFVHGDSHSFKDATCAAPKTCTICGATEGVADNTAHATWGEGVLTRPTKTEEGYYTYTCSACGATKTEAAQRAANYAEYTKALNDLRAYLDSDKLTDDVKASVAEWLEIYDSDEAYKFIAGEEETVNLYIEAALYYATEIEAAIQDCLAGNHSGNGEYCDICGAALHICDFTGEWKYDTEKHWKECECGETSEEAEHTYTDSKCDCGYECPHEDTYNNLIRPVQNADGTWGKGKIVEICNNCGKSSLVQEVERDHEGYKVFDETAAELEAILNSGKMTDTWKNDYTNRLNGLRNSAYYQVYTEIETAIPSMTESLKSIIAEIEAGIADGSIAKADFTYMTSLFDEINALIDSDPNKLTPDAGGMYRGIYNGYYVPQSKNNNHSQESYNLNGKYYETQLENLLAAIKDGSKLKADYTEIDEAIAEIDRKLADENVTDEAKSGLEEIKADLEEMKNNPLSSKADLAVLEKALEDYEAEVDAGIEDGTAVEVDGIEILLEYQDELRENLIKKYGEENYNNLMNSTTDEVKEKAIAIEEAAEALTGTVAENAEKIAEIKASFKALFDEAELCLAGTHSYTYEEISPAKCGENAIEEGVCWFCGEVLTREVENSALKHSFTKYEVTEEAKCGVEGKEVAYCDNGCGETDEKEIEALKHLFIDYIYNEDATCTADGTKTAECVYGCGETDTVTAEDTMLNHADEDSDGICDDCETEIKDVCPDCGGPAHEETGVSQYICMIITFMKLIFSLVRVLQAVA